MTTGKLFSLSLPPRTKGVNVPLRTEPETQEACQGINHSPGVTILVSDARGRKAPFTCRVSKTQPPMSSAGPRCGCWGVRQRLVRPSPSLPRGWDSPHLRC